MADFAHEVVLQDQAAALQPRRGLYHGVFAPALNTFFNVGTIILLAVEVAVVFLGVLLRYAFALPIYGVDELARLVLIWLSFFGGAVALRESQHVGVNIVVQAMPEKVRNILHLLVLELSLALFGVLLWQSWELYLFRAGQVSPALEVPYAVFVAPMLIGVAGMIIYGLAQLLRAPRVQVLATVVGLALAAYLIHTIGDAMGFDVRTVNPLFFMVAGFLLFLLVGSPISFSLAGMSFIFLLGIGAPLITMPQRIVAGMDSFVLLAIPLFVVAGALMETGGISQRLIDLAMALVGHIKGGLAFVVVVAEILFSGISGSTTADVAAVGSLLIPSMVKAGYKEEEAVSIVSAASAMGILVPPCLLMVIIGALADLSVTKLFLAGFLPAFVVAAGLLALIYYKARRGNWPTAEKASGQALKKALVGSIIPLFMPVLIFGSIFSGAATVTEAAVLAVVYALIVSVFIYREIKISELPKIFLDSGSMTGMVFWLVGGSTLFTWLLARQQAPQQVAHWITSVSSETWFFILASIVIFSLLGGLLEGFPSVIILLPIFLPIATSMHVDPIHFSILVTACVGIGLFLPPVGIGLFIGCTIGRTTMSRIIRPFAPYLGVLVLMTIIVGLVPEITLIVPRILEGK